MASCRSCGQTVAGTAWKCQACGDQLATRSMAVGKIALVVVVVAIALALFG